MNSFVFLFNTINGDYMKISDVMSRKLIVGSVSDDISVISNKMLQYDIGFVPIVDGKYIVGVITDRDIACRIFSNCDLDPNIVSYMSRDIVYVDVNDNIDCVMNKMRRFRVKRVLVSDNDKVVGILSISDLLSIDDVSDDLYDVIRSIWKVDSNVHYDTEVDEFYLWKKIYIFM